MGEDAFGHGQVVRTGADIAAELGHNLGQPSARVEHRPALCALLRPQVLKLDEHLVDSDLVCVQVIDELRQCNAVHEELRGGEAGEVCHLRKHLCDDAASSRRSSSVCSMQARGLALECVDMHVQRVVLAPHDSRKRVHLRLEYSEVAEHCKCRGLQHLKVCPELGGSTEKGVLERGGHVRLDKL